MTQTTTSPRRPARWAANAPLTQATRPAADELLVSADTPSERVRRVASARAVPWPEVWLCAAAAGIVLVSFSRRGSAPGTSRSGRRRTTAP